MTTLRIEEIQHDLTYYLGKVEAGESFVITRGGQPVAEIKPVAAPAEPDHSSEEEPPEKKLRPYGLAKGEFEVPKEFDDPLPEEFLRYFTG